MLQLALKGGAFERPNWLYRLDFIAYPLLAAILFLINCRSLAWIGLSLAGLVLFSFVEYWVHRIPLHKAFYHGAHERHHTHPSEYVVFPIYTTPTVFFGFWLILPLSVFAGFIVGYIWFIVWHDVLHHQDLSKWPHVVRRYALWHLAHHHDQAVNFGITMSLWDWVFRTYRRTDAA